MPYADFCPVVRLPYDNLSRRGDTKQISWGKLSRFQCTVAGSTPRTLDGYGLRSKLPARPALTPYIRFFPSTRTFAPHFLQTPPRGDSPCVITSPSPPSGWAGDFHPQAAEHAQHTTTLGCAQCHNHKYDPFTQQDYYRVFAFFENSDYRLDGVGTSHVKLVEPILELPDPEKEARRKRLTEEIRRREEALNTQTSELDTALELWEKQESWKQADRHPRECRQ